jgi:predicted dehydrogenase
MAQSSRQQRDKIRYAVVGLGHIAQTAVLPAFKHAAENSQLSALVSDDREKLDVLSKKYGVTRQYSYAQYEQCLRSGEIDAVYIALPNHLHCEYAVRAAKAGVHVLCEKPMAVREQECEQMIHAAETGGVKLMVAYRLHFEEANLKAIELVKSGRLGEPRIFDSVFTMSVKEGNIRVQSLELGGGTVYDLGVYCINAARYLFQDEPIEVLAASANNGEPRFAESDEMTSAVLRFPSERLAVFTSSFGASDVSTYQLVGTKGNVRLDPAYEYAGDIKQEITIDGETELSVFKKRDQFAPELVYFSNCIVNDEEPEPSGWEGLADVRVVRAVYEAARTGRPVKLPAFERRSRPRLGQEIKKPAIAKPPEEVNARKPSTD